MLIKLRHDLQGGGERRQGMQSYPRCSVGVPGLAARVGGWVYGGAAWHVCLYACMWGGPLGGLVEGGDDFGC
jgi:hypothetical protein